MRPQKCSDITARRQVQGGTGINSHPSKHPLTSQSQIKVIGQEYAWVLTVRRRWVMSCQVFSCPVVKCGRFQLTHLQDVLRQRWHLTVTSCVSSLSTNQRPEKEGDIIVKGYLSHFIWSELFSFHKFNILFKFIFAVTHFHPEDFVEFDSSSAKAKAKIFLSKSSRGCWDILELYVYVLCQPTKSTNNFYLVIATHWVRLTWEIWLQTWLDKKSHSETCTKWVSSLDIRKNKKKFSVFSCFSLRLAQSPSGGFILPSCECEPDYWKKRWGRRRQQAFSVCLFELRAQRAVTHCISEASRCLSLTIPICECTML